MKQYKQFYHPEEVDLYNVLRPSVEPNLFWGLASVFVSTPIRKETLYEALQYDNPYTN